MKRVFWTFIVACIFIVSPANAQFDCGIKAGVNFSGKLNNIIGTTEEHVGWYAGPMVKFIFPIIGLGCEANVLYSNTGIGINSEMFNRHSIEIPVYLRYELSLPAIKRIIEPFIAVGPQWGFTFGKNEFGEWRSDGLENGWETERYFKFKKGCFSLNVGIGFILFNHLQIHANYNIALEPNCEYLDPYNIKSNNKNETTKLRNNIWQLSLAYLF